MKYNLAKVILGCNSKTGEPAWIELVYINPDCHLEKEHKITLFGNTQIWSILNEAEPKIMQFSEIRPRYNLNVEQMPDSLKVIEAQCVEVKLPFPCVVKKPFTKRKLPVIKTSVMVFCPMVKDSSGNYVYASGWSPEQQMQSILNRTLQPI